MTQDPFTPPAGRPVYLAWTTFQRRQVSMAELVDFDCVFLPLGYKGRSHLLRAWHYLGLLWRTWCELRARRPAAVWMQIPQTPLLWMPLLYRAVFDRRVQLVADCHNAAFRAPWSRVPAGLSLLRHCDLVLVHNQDVHAQALAAGLPSERLRVLEDVPPLRHGETRGDPPAAFAGRPRPWVLFPGSYGHDEPVAELLQAARLLGDGVVAVTGRLTNAARNGHDIGDPPTNVLLSGYLPVEQFDALLQHADVVLALTRLDGIQLSVCNEALGFGRPMVMSDTPLLRRLFGSAAVCVDSARPEALAAGIRQAWAEAPAWRRAAIAMATDRRRRWQDEQLRACLAVLDTPTSGTQPVHPLP